MCTAWNPANAACERTAEERLQGAERNVSSPLRGFRALLLLSLFLIAVIVLNARPAGAEGPDSSSAPGPITSEELRNLTYPNEFATNDAAALADGTHTEPVEPDSAAQVMVQFQRAAFGAIGGESAAAVVLATNAGGSGTFYDLHLVMRDGGGVLRSVALRALGDRIRLQGLVFVGEAVRIDFTGFADDDPFCCPTLNVAQEFRLSDNELELVRAFEAPALLAVPEGLSLVGWFGGPTTSSAILASAPLLDSIWAYDPSDDSWIGDARGLPDGLRRLIAVDRGSGLFLLARAATELRVPLLPAPTACPLNPGPPHPVDPSMIVQGPGAGERLTGVVPVAGLARVFEGNVRIRILAADGDSLADTHTTAETGGPYFGAFAAEIPVTVAVETAACVQIFEDSVLDGSLINVVQIGVTLAPTP